MNNIDTIMEELMKDNSIYEHEDENLTTEEISVSFLVEENLKVLKYITIYDITIEKYNIQYLFYDREKDLYFYDYIIPKKNTDVINNIKCKEPVFLILNNIDVIECNTNNLTLPVFYMKNYRASLYIMINGYKIEKRIPLKIRISYDTYVFDNDIKETIKNNKSNALKNNENMTFYLF
jgi:hypothetical protein